LILSLAGLTVLVLALLLLPLLHGWRAQAERRQFDKAVYRAQLDELDRDVARGLISGPDVAAARLEIERRLLAADTVPAATPRLGRSRSLALATALIIAGGAGLAYMRLGAPGVPDVPFAEQHGSGATATSPHGDDMAGAAATLAAKLKANPSDAQGWLLYARSEAELGNWDKSADGYAHAIALGQNAPDVVAGHAEMLVLAAGGIVGAPARAEFAQAVKDDPKSEVARYYLALADAQAGESRRAIEAWQALAADLPEDSPMRDAITHGVADAASAAGIAAPALPKGQPASAAANAPASAAVQDMPPAQREQMIRSMVTQLAERLAKAPNDLDGWLQLGRAYAVLGEPDKATDAYDHATKLKPQDPDIQVQEIGALIDNNPPNTPVPPRAVELLQQVAAVTPDRPEVLWYQGMVAAHSHQPADAKRYWQHLLTLLPADSEDHKMVASALQDIDAH
jgi:cytochrome c-type biogenesis protein CcmH